MTAAAQAQTKLIVGYFPGWAIHARNYYVSDIPARFLTHVCYAFAGVSNSGACASIRPQDDQINFPQLQLLKQQSPGLKTLISVGGVSHSDNFSQAAATAAGRQLLAQSCLSFMKTAGFDGIDIDWEFPEATDKQNFSALLKELRNQLDAQGAADGKQYLLTAALSAAPENYANNDLMQICQYVDWINLMGYGFYTASDAITHFSAPLYPATGDPEPDAKKRASYNVDAAVRAYLAAGVPASQIVLGIPLFGYGWQGVADVNHGLYQAATGAAPGTWSNDGVFDFNDLNSNYVPTYLRFWSVEASAPWLYSPAAQIMISYDDAQSAATKAGYVTANSLGGVMVWPLSSDDSQASIVQTLFTNLNPPLPTSPPPGVQPPLTSAARRIEKATYVPLQTPVDSRRVLVGGAVTKYAYVQRLDLQPGEVSAVQANMPARADPTFWQALNQFEGTPLPAQLPPMSAFAGYASEDLLAFGTALNALRLERLNQQTGTAQLSPAIQTSLTTDAAMALQHLNTSLVATNAFVQTASATPIGMLNLERLEMSPAGLERGELLATICLAPLEQTAVVQKEWSVTSKEFTSIVTDSLENYSETGVTENTELTQATTAQNQHTSQFNVNATVSGSIGFVTGTVSSGFSSQDQNSNSATASSKHAIATTKKASTRVKQEHKVTISTTTVTGTSETTTRILQNSSPTNPMRIDYFSLMRRWDVALYRYGLRLTYDIVIPEPGGILRKAYMQLAALQAQANQGFTFPVKVGDIDRTNWMTYASQYQVNLPPPPPDTQELSFISSYTAQDQSVFTFSTMELDLPDGYDVSSAMLTADQAIGSGSDVFTYPSISVMHAGIFQRTSQTTLDVTTSLDFLTGLAGKQYVVYGVITSPSGVVQVDVQLQLTDDAFAAWQQQAWAALYSAYQNTYYSTQQSLQTQIQNLQDRLNNVDTLTLRREENDEIMRGVLQWLLGPGFDFMPDSVRDLFTGPLGPDGVLNPAVYWGAVFTGNKLVLSTLDWSTVANYEQIVRFVNDAIDWDNLLYFLYSYFWDVPDSWDNIRNIQHPDSIRQAFLRAGSARVVLTVRKGWETAWVKFVEGGEFTGSALPELHPYLTIAQEIEDYDNQNYPGIPAANPGGPPLPDDGRYVATTSSDKVAPSTAPVTLNVVSSSGFLVGYQAILDTWDSGVQEVQTIMSVPDDSHVSVSALKNAHDGSSAPFAVRQAGEKGLLIAEWFEYTPTSATDIAINSDVGSVS